MQQRKRLGSFLQRWASEPFLALLDLKKLQPDTSLPDEIHGWNLVVFSLEHSP